MRNETDQLELAKWTLDRNLHWISAAEVKTAVIAAANTAMLAALATSFGAVEPSDRTGWPMLFSVLASLCLLAALICSGMSVLPRTDGPASSFVFFGRVAKHARPDYSDAFRNASTDAFLQDILDQTHRNAQIADTKFRWVRNAMWWSFLSILPWVLALGALTSAARP
jgi:hypothetical protein